MKDILEHLDMIILNSELALFGANQILQYKESDYYSRHKASEIKAKEEDNIRLARSVVQQLKQQ